TFYPEVAVEAIKNGVDIINDITGLRNEKMIEVILKFKKPVIIMHMKGEPQNMQIDPHYSDVVEEIKEFFKEKIEFLLKHKYDDIIIDPGIGFGKKIEHNIQILKNLSSFKKFGFPIMIGTSRKSFIGMITGEKIPAKRVSGTIASCLYVYEYADIFRVHDTYEILQAFAVWKALKA
ncbi:MAG: dihydropteroate synthase, partial [Elusimicrobiales bacterium]|nr:dihydropteroate synthase [Elusimicrobiales bacterium]